jgi:tRNA dimethylallyltransferase
MSWDAVLIAGPTASGKSQAALGLAEQLNGTVINTDSMQVYSELRILTARPSADDEARVPHRLYGHVPARERYSVGHYAGHVENALPEILGTGRLPIFVGGTGLYFKALEEGLSPMPPVPPEIRAALEERLDAIGLEAFFAELAANDPETAANLKSTDRQRILRAASVLEATGRPLAHWQQTPGAAPLEGMKIARFVLAPPREELYARIEKRFAAMMEAGALDEARALTDLDPGLPAFRALGLPELIGHLADAVPVEMAKEQAILKTRRYAKRQMTWLRRFMADWKWLENGHLRNIIAEMSQ